LNRNEDHAVLLVEDEPRAAQMLAKGLREQADAVDVVGDGKRAVYQAAITEYDAIVLDVVLPLQDGLAVFVLFDGRDLFRKADRALYITRRD
jgi:DNA-binding response OmpR family regulator